MYWKHVQHDDPRARLMADRHYSRQTIGAREFMPAGNKIVLLGLNGDAVWGIQRPALHCPELQIRKDGFSYWSNSIFRNESNHLASELIIEAIAVTLYLWGYDAIPADGIHTFIDTTKVKPTMRRGVPTWGYTYLKAGFSLHPERTKERKLIRVIMTAAQLRTIKPLSPLREIQPQARQHKDGMIQYALWAGA